jgi:hypothetical protein
VRVARADTVNRKIEFELVEDPVARTHGSGKGSPAGKVTNKSGRKTNRKNQTKPPKPKRKRK